jgi:hypothetical protein
MLAFVEKQQSKRTFALWTGNMGWVAALALG